MARILNDRNFSLVPLLLFMAVQHAYSADVAVTALFNGKAVVVVDGGKPRTLTVGESTPEGVKLISANSESAVIESGGQRQTLQLGQGTRVGRSADASGSQVTLTADARGHFITNGAINGVSVRFLIDTGATSVALSTSEARRLGINYLAGTRAYSSTANGVVPLYRVTLDNVRIGDISVGNVEAAVLEGSGLDIALLGMSFLKRMQMKRDGDTLTLLKRY
ncbi:MAG TPA: TIGR02281 family clan AA aspartic protease [Longimicrobiales bacterium]|nr:TIGR02281 family clan AA aspartic protease [Longimicrobiales bacterium]